MPLLSQTEFKSDLSFFGRRSSRYPCTQVGALFRLLVFVVSAAFFVGMVHFEDAEAKRKKKRRVEPPLSVRSITFSPEEYVSGDGSLDILVEVRIPTGTDGTTLLEISSLISSRSKRHVRFLTWREPVSSFIVADPVPEPETETPDATEEAPPAAPVGQIPQQVSVTLTWDGTDQYHEVMMPGRYDYVIRAKLLTATDDGPRTQMVSWKKKGKLVVNQPAVEEPESSDVDGEAKADSKE